MTDTDTPDPAAPKPLEEWPLKDLQERAGELDLPGRSKMTAPELVEAIAAKLQEDPPLDVGGFVVGDVALAVPVSGLITALPELREATMPASKWQELLDAYNASDTETGAHRRDLPAPDPSTDLSEDDLGR